EVSHLEESGQIHVQISGVAGAAPEMLEFVCFDNHNNEGKIPADDDPPSGRRLVSATRRFGLIPLLPRKQTELFGKRITGSASGQLCRGRALGSEGAWTDTRRRIRELPPRWRGNAGRQDACLSPRWRGGGVARKSVVISRCGRVCFIGPG